MLRSLTFVPIVVVLISFVHSRVDVLSSSPHPYTNIPNAGYVYSSANRARWQDYYRVNPESLPNATQCRMPSGYAGSIPVNRAGHPNNTLFFWALEKSSGSLTNTKSTNPWILWLNGGPGSSSLLGLGLEVRKGLDFGKLLISFSINNMDHVWSGITTSSIRINTLYIRLPTCPLYIDQPVGTGFATADADGFVQDEDQMSQDFMGFLSNLVQVFPGLQKRDLYLMGESYAGTYIPYIMKKYFQMKNPPVKVKHVMIGDGCMDSSQAFQHAATVEMIETYPQLIDYNIDVYKYFREQTHLCGYDVNMSFPQSQHLPSLRSSWINPPDSDAEDLVVRRSTIRQQNIAKQKLTRLVRTQRALAKRDTEHRERDRLFKRTVSEIKNSTEYRTFSRRNLQGRANGTIDPWYQCGLLWELWDYAVNFTAPWSKGDPNSVFDVYYLQNALSPPVNQDLTIFLGDPRTVAALHAPQNRPWLASIDYPFGNVEEPDPLPDNDWGDPSPAPVDFLSELATDGSMRDIRWTFFDAQGDSLSGTMATLMVIQNTTFGGVQGFTRRPGTAWFGLNNQLAGVVHQERRFTSVLFADAGHQIPIWQPENYIIALREFVFGNNKNGSIDASGKLVGTPFELSHAFNIPGENKPVFTGSGATIGSTVWPTATIAAWNSALKPLISPTPAT